MAAWADLSAAVSTVLTGSSVTLARDPDPARWPSWAVGTNGAPRWAAVTLEPITSPIQGGMATTQHRMTVRSIAGTAWSWEASKAAILDGQRSMRALFETTAGLLDGSAQFEFDSASHAPLGACYLVEVTFIVRQYDTY